MEIFSQGWVGTAIGAIGVALAIIFHLKSRHRPGLAFAAHDVSVIGRGGAAFPDDVEVRFGGAVVPQLTSTMVFVWNSGNRTLIGKNVVEADPLRVVLPEGSRVLKCEVGVTNRRFNGWRTGPCESGSVSVGFDYLDPRDGAVIAVLHTGGLGQCTLVGTLRALPGGVSDFSRPTLPRRASSSFRDRLEVLMADLPGEISLKIGFFMFLFMLLSATGPVLSGRFGWHAVVTQAVGVGLLYVLASVAVRLSLRRMPPRELWRKAGSQWPRVDGP